jgi:hypothetical protein
MSAGISGEVTAGNAAGVVAANKAAKGKNASKIFMIQYRLNEKSVKATQSSQCVAKQGFLWPSFSKQ